MSSLRKQDVRRKTRKRGLSSNSRSGQPWISGLVKALRAPLAVGLWVGTICRRYPRTSVVTGAALLTLTGATWTTRAVYEVLESRLPTSIAITCDDSGVAHKANLVAWRTLQDARAHKQTRSEFLSALSARMATIDGIDEFKVRAGLDKKLQIWAAAQTPAFVLEGADSQRVVISTRLQAIETLAAGTTLPGLAIVLAPEAKISQRVSFSKEKNPHSVSVSGVNLPWIYRQIKLVANAAPSFSGHKFEAVSFAWKQTTGLSVRLARKKEGTDTGDLAMTAIFGDTDMESKIQRLLRIAEHFSTKESIPEIVDLNYPDRAIIRMGLSDAGTPLSF